MAETGLRDGDGLENARVARTGYRIGTRTATSSRRWSASVTEAGQPARAWWQHLGWVGMTGLVGFLVPAIFVGMLELPRAGYLVVYFAAVGGLVCAYARWSGMELRRFAREHWVTGLAVGAAVSVFTVRTVLMQPSSPSPEGLDLAFNLTWLGLLYGAADALLLSILPVYATWRALSVRGWTDRWAGRFAAGALATFASMAVILVYHLGYPECRGPQVAMIVVGVAAQSLGYLIARSPIAPVLSHVAMHVAAVLYGLNSVSQLPPHY